MIICEEYEYKYYVEYKIYSQIICNWCNACIGIENKKWKAEWGGYAFMDKEDAIMFELAWG